MVKSTTWRVALSLLMSAAACRSVAQNGVHEPRAVGTKDATANRLEVGLRRLTNREFLNLASGLLGVELGAEFEASLPPDVRQEDGYARNVAQTMSGALAVTLEERLPQLARHALSRRGSSFSCEHVSAEQPCVRNWIADVSERAWRRPVTSEELERLTQLYRSGLDARDGAFRKREDGAVAVLTALLLSPDLWYVRELGEQQVTGSIVELTPYEVADQISIVMRGTLADEALLADARRGRLAEGGARQAHARRLLARADTRDHYREFVLSWLEVDQLDQTSKSPAVFQPYEAFKPRMLAETQHFVDTVFMSEGASIGSLLGAGFVSVDPEMAVFYGLNAFGTRVNSDHVGRMGVLQQASFLASHSQADTTSPVLRGDFVLRKVLCHRLPRPSELDIEVTMPRPRRDMTRREQFALHGADPRCSDCHAQIDGFGLVFEEFDAAGRRREFELDKPIRKDGKVTYRGTEHAFADSAALVRWLQGRSETSECFARQLFRFVTGRVDARAEAAFLELRNDLDENHRDNVLEHLVSYVGSEQFVQRRRP